MIGGMAFPIHPPAPLRRAWRGVSSLRRLLAVLASVAVLSLPAAARADDDEVVTDGRLEGYKDTVALPKSGTGTTYLLLVVLVIVGLAGLFKDAKRSHLD